MPKHFRLISLLFISLSSVLLVLFQNFTQRNINSPQVGDCMSGNKIVARNGEARTFFRKSFVPISWGNTCSAYSLVRRCINGTLSGEEPHPVTGEYFDNPTCRSERDTARPFLSDEAVIEFETAWKLVFNDEFVKKQDFSPWAVENIYKGKGMWLGGYRVPEQAEISSGILRILNREGKRAPYPEKDTELIFASGYKKIIKPSQTESAQLMSKAEFGYGYFEARAKMSKGGSIDSAFWLMNNNGSEIDIFETLYVNDNKYVVKLSAHPRDLNSNTPASPRFTVDKTIEADLAGEFHIYGVMWRPDIIVYYIDGIEQARITDPVTLSSFVDRKLKIRLSTAMSNFFCGVNSSPCLDKRSYNSEMVVDYVRHYVEVDQAR